MMGIGGIELAVAVLIVAVLMPESLIEILRLIEAVQGVPMERRYSRVLESAVEDLKALRKSIAPGIAVMLSPIPLSIIPATSSKILGSLISLIAPGINVFTVSWYDPIYASMSFLFSLSLPAGLVGVACGTAYWIWRGLKPGEKAMVRRFLVWLSVSLILSFPYSLMECRMLLTFVQPMYTPSSVRQGIALVELARTFEGVCMGTMLLLCTPIIVWLLRSVGVIDAKTMGRIKPAYVIITWGVAMFITPDPTPITTLMIWLPCVLPILLIK